MRSYRLQFFLAVAPTGAPAAKFRRGFVTNRTGSRSIMGQGMSYLLKLSQTARPLLFLMVDGTDHVSGKTGVAPSVTLSKNGAAFAAPAGAVTELSGGWYKVAGNATDTGTLGPLLLHATAAGADPADVQYEVVSFDPEDAVGLGLSAVRADIRQVTGNAVPATTLNGALKVDIHRIDGRTFPYTIDGSSNAVLGVDTRFWQAIATTLVGGRPDVNVGAMSANVVTAAAIATDAIGAAELAADAVTEIAAAVATTVWQDLTSGADFGTVASIGKLLKDNINAPLSGLAQAATALSSDVWTNAKAALLDVAVSSRSSHTAADVWAVGARTITGGTITAVTGLTIGNVEQASARVLSMTELSAGLYRMTAAALALAPTGGGTGSGGPRTVRFITQQLASAR